MHVASLLTSLADAARAALEWLASRAPLFLPHSLAEPVQAAARRAAETARQTHPATALTAALREVRREKPALTAYTVAVAATAAADTLIAQLERNNWDTSILEENRWINRLLKEKTQPDKVTEALQAIRQRCGYTTQAQRASIR